VHEVPVVPRADGALLLLAEDGHARAYEQTLRRCAERLAGRTLWHINSTAAGGGVAELLRSCLGYLRNGGIDTRWLVFQGDRRFFEITKRIHNRLHGDDRGDGALGATERRHLDTVSARNLAVVARFVRSGDVVIVHDPQPIGLLPGLARLGATVIWTCHVGTDTPNDIATSTWEFLRPDLLGAHAVTFTRAAYVWSGLERIPIALIPPCIDPLSLKNVNLEPARREAILAAAGLLEPSAPGEATFTRSDGALAHVNGRADVVEANRIPAGAPIALQVSRWDHLKDPVGVLEGFAKIVGEVDAHLVLAGPAPGSVADDPQAGDALAEVRAAWVRAAAPVRARVHLASLPAEDIEENAVIVNALQRRAAVVVQKSLAEGFGLTVTEAMWKARPVVASRIGGIRDQLEDGVNGRSVDPLDLTAFGDAVASLLDEPDLARRYGAAARERVRGRYLPPTYLGAYLELIERVDRANAP